MNKHFCESKFTNTTNGVTVKNIIKNEVKRCGYFATVTSTTHVAKHKVPSGKCYHSTWHIAPKNVRKTFFFAKKMDLSIFVIQILKIQKRFIGCFFKREEVSYSVKN